MPKFFLFFLMLLGSHSAFASCVVLTSNQEPAPKWHDAISTLLFSKLPCAEDALQFRQQLLSQGLTLQPTLVANRGFHNTQSGSFSLFEMVSGKLNQQKIDNGDFFFGHFIEINANGYLALAQEPDKNALMIEALAWDSDKNAFNFYELRGNGKKGQWYYRGDSRDIFADNATLHRQLDPQKPVFGNRLRCSACHGAGGPIMKELAPPHNDWWEPTREFDLAGNKPDATLAAILITLVPAEELAIAVTNGIKKMASAALIYPLSLTEQLRPLFCPVELNLMSDEKSNDSNASQIHIPAEFFIDKHLLPHDALRSIVISRKDYEAALIAVDSHFDNTAKRDADHAWLMPVKANSDELWIDGLVQKGLIDTKFVADVLSIDSQNPVFSHARCALLKFVPAQWSRNWREKFIKKLIQSENNFANELAHRLQNPTRTLPFYQQHASQFITRCQTNARDGLQVKKLYLLLLSRRAEIMASEISANPRGQILEPGFRVVFPEAHRIPKPLRLKLNEACEVVSD